MTVSSFWSPSEQKTVDIFSPGELELLQIKLAETAALLSQNDNWITGENSAENSKNSIGIIDELSMPKTTTSTVEATTTHSELTEVPPKTIRFRDDNLGNTRYIYVDKNSNFKNEIF